MPRWTKYLAIISLALIVLFFSLFIVSFLMAARTDGPGISTLIPLVFIVLIIGMWILGFLNRYLVVTNKKWLANIISILIPIGIIGYFGWAFIWQITHYPELVGSFSQNAFFLTPLLIVAIYFIVSLVLINKTKK